ncbi:MAG TPA: outer membrane lipoprotein carrier protein LolA [Candidatus Binataceae bacterium]
MAFLVASMALMFSPPARADDHVGGSSLAARDSAVLDRIQDHYQHTNSFTAKFTEELTGIGGARRTRSGRVSYKKPGKMRWEFDSPQTETVISDGHKLYDYQPDLNQVMEVPIERAFKSAAPLTFLLGMGNLQRDFNASLPAPVASDPLLRVVLTPKGGGDRIEMGLNPSTYDLMAVKVTDALGNTTSIRFSAVRANVQLADSMFHFVVPPGADVVAAPGASQRL